MEGFSRRDGVLFGDGVSFEALAERFGTPLYVYSRSSLTAALAAWNAAYGWAPHRVCYAVKANASGAILRLFASLGAGADIVSGGAARGAEGWLFSRVHRLCRGGEDRRRAHPGPREGHR